MHDVAALDTAAGSRVDAPPVTDEVIELTVPARHDQLRLVRLTAAGVASSLGFGLERLEELRIAVDELAAVAIDEALPGHRVALRFAGDEGTLSITGRVPTGITVAPELHPVAKEILGLMADGYSLDVSEGVMEFHLVKHGAADGSQE